MRHYSFALVSLGIMLAACTNQSTDDQSFTKTVNTMDATPLKVSVPVRLPAQLRGKEDIAIVPQVSATIESVLVHEGDRVEKGQPMFVLNQTAYRAAVDNARAGVANAEVAVQTQELELAAKQQLLDKDIISEHEFRIHENKVRMAKASLAEAQAMLRKANNDLDYTIIRAPHTGVVGVINYKQGSLVGPTIEMPITVVSDNSVIYAYTSISGDLYLYYVSQFGSKEKMLRELPDFSLILGKDVYYQHSGRLETISGIIDANTGAVSLRIAFPNPNGLLAAGGSGQVEVCFEQNAITLPRTAVFGIQDKNFVYTIEPADSLYLLRQTQVEVSRLNDTTYIVSAGLKAGDCVVTDGVKKLTNGEEVKLCK